MRFNTFKEEYKECRELGFRSFFAFLMACSEKFHQFLHWLWRSPTKNE